MTGKRETFGWIRRLIPTGIFLVILAGIAAGCKSSANSAARREKAVSLPDQELWDARIVFSQNERVTSILNASHIEIYERRGLTIADSDFVLHLFDNQGRHTSMLTADSGVVSGEDSLQAYGDVEAVSDSGVHLRSERLFWYRRTKTVYTDTFVVVTTVTDTLYGDSLISDEAIQNWQVFNPRGKTVRVMEKPSKGSGR